MEPSPTAIRGTLLGGLFVVVAVVKVAGWAVGAEPDGTQIDGIWVGQPVNCPATGDRSCARLAECAAQSLWPSHRPNADLVRFFDLPERLKNGTLITRGTGGTVVVFDGPNGARRSSLVLSTDSC
jgi:hypothetical protein